MDIDTAIRTLAISESQSSGEALIMIAKHRAELAQALSEARAEGESDPTEAKTVEFAEAARSGRAAPQPSHTVDKTV